MINIETPPPKKNLHFYLLSLSLPSLHLTLADGAGSTGLRQAVALPHRAAQADVHEALCGS